MPAKFKLEIELTGRVVEERKRPRGHVKHVLYMLTRALDGKGDLPVGSYGAVHDPDGKPCGAWSVVAG